MWCYRKICGFITQFVVMSQSVWCNHKICDRITKLGITLPSPKGALSHSIQCSLISRTRIARRNPKTAEKLRFLSFGGDIQIWASSWKRSLCTYPFSVYIIFILLWYIGQTISCSVSHEHKHEHRSSWVQVLLLSNLKYNLHFKCNLHSTVPYIQM